jgi:hypothetical protein
MFHPNKKYRQRMKQTDKGILETIQHLLVLPFAFTRCFWQKMVHILLQQARHDQQTSLLVYVGSARKG